MQGVYVRRIAYGFLVVMTLINLFPIVWLLISSTKPEIEMFQVPPTIVPRTPSLENYEVALFKKPFLHYLMNSAVIVLSATLLSTMTAAIAAYGLSRYRFPGSRLFVVFLLIVRMIPGIAILVPMFVLMKNLNLVDTYLCLVLAYGTFSIPFGILMMRGFYEELPLELEESAMLDGCTRLGAFLRIAFPLSAPGLAATSIFNFVMNWNEFLFALVLTSTVASKTVPIGLTECISLFRVMWGPLTAATVVFILPILVFAIFAQRYLVAGLTFGAVKG